MKVAIHQPRASYFLGGAEVSSIEISKMLSYEHDISFITSNNSFSNVFADFMSDFSNIDFHFFNSPKCETIEAKGSLNSWDIEGIIFGENTKDFYSKYHFDIISLFYSGDLFKLSKFDSLAFLHMQGYPKTAKFIDNIAFQKADSMICCSKYVKKQLFHLFGISCDHHYYSSPDLNYFQSQNVFKDIDILYIGRLTKRKGVEVLINSLKHIEGIFKKCIIAGTGDFLQEAIKLIDRLNLRNLVRIIGPVQRDEVLDLMNRSKIFTLPAISSEPFPKSILEAMSVGIPVVSTIVGGIPEIITNEVNGLLVRPNDSLGLSIAFQKLLKDNEFGKFLSLNASKWLQGNFNYNIKKFELLNLYSDIYDNSK